MPDFRIVFLGAGDIGLPSLDALLASSKYEVVAVITQPDKPVGRKQVITPPLVKVRAQQAGVSVLQPEKIRQHVDELKALNADIFVVVAYGQILPKSVLEIPKVACLNIHASLLPRHRGASPIQAAIRDGDAQTGITIMWMDEGLDTGDILLPKGFNIQTDETGGALHDRLAAFAPACLEEALDLLAQQKAPKIAQDNTLATITRKLERHHGMIDWSRSAVELERLVRAYNPWPGTWCSVPLKDGTNGQLKVFRASVVEHAEACPVGGTVLEAGPRLLVACGQGVLELLEVQMEGRKRMSARDFLSGQALEAGTLLG